MNIRAMETRGSDAPHRQAELTISCDGYFGEKFAAYWQPGFCGCGDCPVIVGRGTSEQEAIADYWERWEAKHGTTN